MLLCDIASLIRLSITIFVGCKLPAHKIFRSVESLNPARSRFNNRDYSTAQSYANIRTSAAMALPPVSKLDMFPKAHCIKELAAIGCRGLFTERTAIAMPQRERSPQETSIE
jgi:hypothetical protein